MFVVNVEINKADYHMLLRVPGIGVRSAQRIVKARRVGSLDFGDLRKMGTVMKRARYFITCKGRYYDKVDMNETFITQNLLQDKSQIPAPDTGYRQLSLFPAVPELPAPSDVLSSITGEI